jgi:hypothetical protein
LKKPIEFEFEVEAMTLSHFRNDKDGTQNKKTTDFKQEEQN